MSDLYAFSVPAFRRGLTVLSDILGKGLASAESRKIDPAYLLSARLAPDMLSLTRQVQIATDTARRTVARLLQVESPAYEDTETSFADLHARIERTIAWISSHAPEKFAAAEGLIIEQKFGPTTLTLSARDNLTRFALPNFYFHLTTTYDILRHNGVPIGKRDFLGQLAAD